MTPRAIAGLPVGEAVELDEVAAERALFDTFGVLDQPHTEPMPLALEVIEDEAFRVHALRVLGRRK